ncbi:hypothetical protein BC937DRAFT_90903 [Endogone sp. FLAS-F59071]|nr:hypothetical protein BC937DRAFT_90903 [Endogone sp. FLAS-F59071]|eukprot:RUS16699.1 hypothetical protein BC937DRAFT_90903 [Endogone sp. FLAS-F59071]
MLECEFYGMLLSTRTFLAGIITFHRRCFVFITAVEIDNDSIKNRSVPSEKTDFASVKKRSRSPFRQKKIKIEDASEGDPVPSEDEGIAQDGPTTSRKPKGSWTKEDERFLITQILEDVKPRWTQLSNAFGGKHTGNSCLKKWHTLKKKLIEG